MDTPKLPEQHPVNLSQSPAAPPPWWHDRVKLTFVIVVGILAMVVTALLLMMLNRGGEAAVASATPTPSAESTAPSPSASLAEPTSSAVASSSIDPSPTASASVEPSREPQAELAQGWARIDTGLNLRDGPGEAYAIITKLQPRDVVWVNSGPSYDEATEDERDWYYVQTLKDKYGWVASGPPDDPYATNISNQFTFTSCGGVQVLAHSALVNGLRTPRMDDVGRASLELAQAMRTRACQRFSNEDYDPRVRLDLEVHACGAPSWDGSVVSIQPTTAGNVVASWRVPSALRIPAPLLTDGAADDADGLTNAQKILKLGSDLSSPFACVTAVHKKEYRQNVTTEVADCFVMTSRDSDSVTFAPVGGDPVTLLGRGHFAADFPLNDPARLRLAAVGARIELEVLGDC